MERKRLFGVLLLSLVLVSMFAVGVVAETADAASAVAKIFDPVKDMFASWSEGDISLNVAKYAVWLLLTLFIYAIVAFIPFVKILHGTLRAVVALIVAFLGTAYLTPANIYSMLVSYGAMGIVLGGAIPFIILLFFSIEMAKEGGAGGRLFSKVLWVVFIFVLIWKLVQGMFFTPVTQQAIGIVEGFVYVGIIVFVFIWIWFLEKKILSALFKEEISGFIKEGSQDIVADLTAEINEREKKQATMGDNPITDNYIAKTNRLKERLKKLVSNYE